MAGLINSNILRDPKTPLSNMTANKLPTTAPVQGPVASTAQALTKINPPTTYDDAGFYAKGIGNVVGGVQGIGQGAAQGAGATGPAPAPIDWSGWADDPWSTGEQTPRQAATESAFDAVVGATKGVAQNFQREVGPTLPTGAPIDWDAWSKTPWETPKPPTKGSLSDPGTGEVGFDQHGKDLIQPGDPKVQYWLDKIGNRESLGKPDLDAWYDREWKRIQGSLNAQAAARGMHGSSDAMRMLHQSRESLGADKLKEEADFAMKSFNADTDRYKLAAALSGEISAQDLEEVSAYLDYAFKAQGAEEGRVRGKTEDLFGAFDRAFSGVIKGWDDLLDADKDLVYQIIMSGPASATERQAQEARLTEGGKAALAQAYKMGFGGVGAGGGGGGAV